MKKSKQWIYNVSVELCLYDGTKSDVQVSRRMFRQPKILHMWNNWSSIILSNGTGNSKLFHNKPICNSFYRKIKPKPLRLICNKCCLVAVRHKVCFWPIKHEMAPFKQGNVSWRQKPSELNLARIVLSMSEYKPSGHPFAICRLTMNAGIANSRKWVLHFDRVVDRQSECMQTYHECWDS